MDERKYFQTTSLSYRLRAEEQGLTLVIGGAYQGKRRVCRQLSGTDEALYQELLADGWKDSPEKALKKPYLAAFHQFLRQVAEQGGDPERYTRKVLAAGPKIISMDEVGCGIVPVGRQDRDYREIVGRCGQLLAASAGRVYRVTCGIPVRIK